MDAMRRIVGDDYVVEMGPDFERAAKATIPDPKRPAALIRPADSEQVAEVVRTAQRFGVPLWPVSQGRNWGYGSGTPAQDDTIVLHLGRLNRILEVNEDLAYAVIEPGVTYRQLRAYLDEHHPGLWCDTTDGPPDGSVIGNALDRGLGVTHYADHFGTLCGLEVVLPDGQAIRTGGGPEHCKTWHTHKWGVGPYLEGLFSQSSFGVVTKAGVWLMPRPETFVSFTFDLAGPEHLPVLVDTLRQMALAGVVQSAFHLINEIVALSVLSQYPANLVDKCSRLPDATLREMCAKHGVAAWSLGGGIQGTKGAVRETKRQLKRRLGPLGRLVFVDDRVVGLAGAVDRWAGRSNAGRSVAALIGRVTGRSREMLSAAPHVHSVLKGIPSDYFVRHAYFKSRSPKPDIADPDRDDVGLIWFAPIAPMTGRHVSEVIRLCQPLFAQHEFDFYAALLMQNARSMIVLMSIFFRKDDPAQAASARALYAELGRVTEDAGYQPYRVSVPGMERLSRMAPGFVSLGRAIKRALDPAGVIAPGKYGI
jgi:4-cresol dehydrogenase (hydroxylating)